MQTFCFDAACNAQQHRAQHVNVTDDLSMTVQFNVENRQKSLYGDGAAETPAAAGPVGSRALGTLLK